MKTTTSLATAFAIGLAMTGSVLCHAQNAPDKVKRQFNNLDTDKNGSISLEEYKARSKTPDTADAKFARLDTDKNGSISFEEFSAAKQRTPAQDKPAADS